MKRYLLLLVALACSSCGLLPGNRLSSSTPVCRNSLRIIDAAKEQAALQYSWTNGTPCDPTDARTKVDQFIKKGMVVCPQGGAYTYNPIGIDPTCSLGRTNVATVNTGWFETTETRQHRLRE